MIIFIKLHVTVIDTDN